MLFFLVKASGYYCTRKKERRKESEKKKRESNAKRLEGSIDFVPVLECGMIGNIPSLITYTLVSSACDIPRTVLMS